ncbi:MAG: CDP-2,3-bis-(O-geranylgeranyl)-sn-glycerol synthase [Candidatus Aenigmatarchaeota archaeon]
MAGTLDIFAVFTIYVLVEATWLVLPAYAANGLVPLFKGKRRLDFGKKFFDGEPILGPGKTIEGLVLGSIVGVIIGLVEMLAFPYLPWTLSDVPLTLVGQSNLLMLPLLGFLLGFGAMVGDSVGSFFKRRLKLKRGQPAPLLDQLDFLFGAFLFASIIIGVPKLEWVILMAILTPVFHFAACVIGYLLKVKKEPW